ncbi:anti-sigma factor family protein [Gordonia sp. (in: high G+C Gram-positive bacteria)]|uniref:anti-sigma factor family protein n=1 Tax=Gordonia sp. (in: high G+C Gram-positive bacteria) TaxID=84139 RepID=UPI003F946EBA
MEHNEVDGQDGVDRHDGGHPSPPYSTEVLIDFHSGQLDPATADRVRAAIADDPDAQRILAALDATNADLELIRDEELPIPPAVRERMLNVIRGFQPD